MQSFRFLLLFLCGVHLNGYIIELLESHTFFVPQFNRWYLISLFLSHIFWVYSLRHDHFFKKV